MLSPDDITQSLELFPEGAVVSHFVIDRVLGAGGMGVVYLARDCQLDRPVALKFLPARVCQDPKSRARLIEEARTIAQLNHPNIVTIHEVGEFDQRPFIAMEFVDGGSLTDYCSKQHRSLEQILELSIQICEALMEAHDHGIVHRDIKPPNILVNTKGSVKVLDFGLACLLGKIDAAPGTIQGTVQYMSPEQLRGLQVDARSDLFSLGVVLYEVLTRRNPFAGENMGRTISAILEHEPPPVNEVSTGVPLELHRLIQRLLAKDPDERYPRAQDVRSDLRYTREALLSGRLGQAGDVHGLWRSIAVLPFANLSPDPEQGYFCEGMAEEILNALTKVKNLRVAARVSSFAFKDVADDAREIGRKLHVETLLEGSVRRSDDHLRITVQLIDVTTGFHIWSEQYDQSFTDVFAIQSEITRSVVSALRLLLTEDAALDRGVTQNTQAYEFFLRGRHYLHRGSRRSLQFAQQMFSRAVELDPDYALAHASLAECCGLLVHFYGETAQAHLALADAASRRAIELDPDLPQVYAARGFALWQLNRMDEAWKAFETAIAMDPHQADTLYLFGRACFQKGDTARAAELFERACKVREHHEARYFAAQAHTSLGHHEEALSGYRRAFRAIEKHVELNPDDARALTMGAVSLCRLGERERGLEWAERALHADFEDAGVQYNAACLFALEGEPGRAIDCLQAAARAGFAHHDWVEKDPDLDSLRSDPRFLAIKWR